MKFGKLIGAIDEGTTSARFIIFRAGTDDIVCYHQITVQSIFPKEDWCEQEPDNIYKTVVDCIQGAIAKLVRLGASAKDIVAVGITNQRESTVVWDRNTGKSLYNAIIWLDNRTTTTVDQLVASIPTEPKDITYLQPICGLPLSPYFSAVKLRWLKDNIPKVRKAMDDGTCAFGTIDSWLIYNLTGGSNGGIHVTDVTNASRTMLMNLATLQWDTKLLQFFGMPSSMLPEIRSSAEVYGKMTLECLKGVPITSCLGDQQAALVGQQCLRRGQAKATFGTGCFMLYNTGSSIVYSKHGLLTTVGYKFGKQAPTVYALEGSIAIAGAAFSWLRDNMGVISSTDEIEPMARKVDDSLDVYFVPAFSGLYAPYWNQDARGVICGLSEETTNDHIVRATLEANCFQVRDILDAMNKDCKIPMAKLMVDGGMTVNTLLLQMLADLVGIQVVRAHIAETTALGAALAAYTVVEPSYNIDAPISKRERRPTFNPAVKAKDRDARYRRWKMAIERALDWDISAQEEDEFFD